MHFAVCSPSHRRRLSSQSNTTMKLSFSLAGKPSSKPKPNTFNQDDQSKNPSSSTDKQFVTEFDSSKTLADAQSKKLVIPPQPNEWRPHKKMKNLDLPVQSDDPTLQFELDPNSAAPHPADPNISYGLNLRQSDDAAESENPNPNNPRLEKNNIDATMLQKLRFDLERLPEDRGFSEFDDMPVEGFGAALLAGYGWHEGRGIGRNAKEDVKIVQYERRTAKEGLGFVADMQTHDKKKEKDGRGSANGDGVGGGVKYNVGNDVRIVGGRDMGLKGRIVEVMNAGDSFVLRLSRSEEEVTVRVSNVAELGSAEEEKCLRKLKQLKIQGSTENGHRSRDSASRGDRSDRKRKDSKWSRGGDVEQEKDCRGNGELSWLTSHIRVRVISKELKGGRLYLKKGKVVDVVGPMVCDVCMDESGQLIQGVNQELLETAIPQRGGPVLVLYGRHKGAFGTLMEKDKDKGTGVVRDADSHALLKVKLEQIAEYIGDPSEIGY